MTIFEIIPMILEYPAESAPVDSPDLLPLLPAHLPFYHGQFDFIEKK